MGCSTCFQVINICVHKWKWLPAKTKYEHKLLLAHKNPGREDMQREYKHKKKALVLAT